jgi:hypothetical protein
VTIFELARIAIEACEAEKVDVMLTGAFATGIYGGSRFTKDVDLVLSAEPRSSLFRVMDRLKPQVGFRDQVEFDTLTWGKRQVGRTLEAPFFLLELFELFDDPFVETQFAQRRDIMLPSIAKKVWVPRAEHLIVRKLGWGRDKDLMDVRDVLIVQGVENLDMEEIRSWCQDHGSEGRLDKILEVLEWAGTKFGGCDRSYSPASQASAASCSRSFQVWITSLLVLSKSFGSVIRAVHSRAALGSS